jgi:parvulin-like peptidyl-prolyl isomerase
MNPVANPTLVNFGPSPVAPQPLLPAANQPSQFNPGELIAVVGSERILAGDMAVFIERIIDKNRERLRTASDEENLRNQLTRQVLRQYVEIKAMYQEFFRDIVGTAPPKEIEDMKKQVTSKAGKVFFEKQVPEMLKKYNATDLRELEEKLAAKSLSLSTLRSQFIEQVLSSELERKYVPNQYEISRQELLDEYHKAENQEAWKVPSRARWRQLTIRFNKHDSRQEVEQLIKTLGNEIFLGGKSFEAVAKQSSEGHTAAEGGLYDWTNQGSLRSKPLDEAIFSLELRKLSKVIEDDIGMHIIEVLEREEGHTKDFTEAQSELRTQLSDNRRDEETRKLRDKVMARTPVWSKWPEDLPGSRPLQEALGETVN